MSGSKEEFLEMSIADLRGDPDLKDGIHAWSGRWVHHTKSGALRHVNIFSHPLRYIEQDAVLVVAHDITETMILQEQLMAERLDRQKEIIKATVDGQERERHAIALELHDNVNQLLSSAKLYFDCLGRYDDDKERHRLTGIRLINDAVEEIRRLSKTLIRPRLHDIGLILSLDDLFSNLSLISEMTVEFSHETFDEQKFDNDLKLTIYRIVQEQMTNVLKHSNAERMAVSLEFRDERLCLSITDNGQGANASLSGKGIGLSSLMSRATLHNGVVTIESASGQGFKLRVDFGPLCK